MATSERGSFGAIETFDKTKHTYEIWLEIFELHCKMHKVSDDDKKLLFLTKLGMETYTDLRALCGARKPESLEYAELRSKIEGKLNPKPSECAERSKFRSRRQRENESVLQFVVEIQKLSRTCNFGDALEENWRDAIVHGVRDRKLQIKLFEEPHLTYRRAYEIIEAWEGTRVSLDTEKKVTNEPVHYIKNTGKGNRKFDKKNQNNNSSKKEPEKERKKCSCCGRANHEFRDCRFKDYTCRICHKVGHLNYVCSEKKQQDRSNNDRSKKKSGEDEKDKNNAAKSHFVANSFSDDDYDLFHNPMYVIKEDIIEPNEDKTLFVTVKVDDHEMSMELDNGAAVSAISERTYHQYFSSREIYPPKTVQRAYDSQVIKSLGYIVVTAKLNVNVAYNLRLFVVKDGAHPLLGREWFSPLGIRVKVSIDRNAQLYSISEDLTKVESDLIQEFSPAVFTEKLGMYKNGKVSLTLKENATPKYFRPRPLPLALKDKIGEEIDKSVARNVFEPVKVCRYGTPIVPVPKPNNSIRICGDYKVTLNPDLVIDRYPIPDMDELIAKIANSEYYSKIDLSHAYQQLEVDEKTQEMLTLSTHKGLFQPKRLMYGVASAPGIFQREIEKVMQGLDKVACFLDDIIIGGRNLEEHVKLLREVLNRLKESGLTVNAKKCTLFKRMLKYLGFLISKDGIKTDPEKISAITEVSVPQNKAELQAFLGMISHIIKFLPNATDLLHPLYDLLKKDASFPMSEECILAFKNVKRCVGISNFLVHFNPKLVVKLRCDASPYGVGGVLLHEIGGKDCPIAYTSRTLNDAEKKYSQIDREALSIVFCVRKFDKYLYGRHFVLETDNQALSFIYGKNKVNKVAANRIQRYGIILAEYDFKIRHIPAAQNKIADGLSRLPLPAVEKGEIGSYINFMTGTFEFLNKEVIKREVPKDEILAPVMKYVCTGWPNWKVKRVSPEIRPYFLKRFDLTIENDCLLWEHKVVIPLSLQKMCLNELHRTHLGVCKMKSLARNHFWWPKMNEQIEQLTANCKICRENRKMPPAIKLHKWKYPTKPGERIHADFGHIGQQTFLVISDQYSKWLEIYWKNRTTAEEIIKCFREYFARWGISELLITDNGPPFRSKEFLRFLSQNGVATLPPSAYHPQSNGAAENAVQTIKDKIKKIVEADGITVQEASTRFLLDYHSAAHSITNKSPAEMQIGRKICTRFDVMMQRKAATEVENFRGTRSPEIKVGQAVLVRQYSENCPKWTEAIVEKKIGEAMVSCDTEDGKIRRHLDQVIVSQPASVNQGEEEVPQEVGEVLQEVSQEPSSLRRSTRMKRAPQRLDL